jgi:hypothetical protein
MRDIIMVVIDIMSVRNDAGMKMNGTNEKCSDVIMKVIEIGTIVCGEKINNMSTFYKTSNDNFKDEL